MANNKRQNLVKKDFEKYFLAKFNFLQSKLLAEQCRKERKFDGVERKEN